MVFIVGTGHAIVPVRTQRGCRNSRDALNPNTEDTDYELDASNMRRTGAGTGIKTPAGFDSLSLYMVRQLIKFIAPPVLRRIRDLLILNRAMREADAKWRSGRRD